MAPGGTTTVPRPVPPDHLACAPYAPGRMTERVCENCGFGDEELASVRRVYVVPEAWDQPPKREVVDPPELWCIPCITQYPCEPVDVESGEED